MKHGSGWEGAAPEFDAAWHEVRRPTRPPAQRCRVWAFFFTDLRQLDSIRTDSASICAKPSSFGQNQAESNRIDQGPK